MPHDLLKDIDSLVGPRGRSAFLVETARAEVRKRKLLEFLNTPGPVWKDEDHPELAAMDTKAWVKMMRSGDDKRLRRLHEMDEPGR